MNKGIKQNICVRRLASIAGLCILFSACSSTPQVEQQSEPEPPIEQPEPVTETPPEQTDNSFSQKNQAGFEQIEQARTAAIAAGAQELYPKEFDQADSRYEALKQKDTENTDLTEEIQDITDLYRSLELAAQAKKMQKEINEQQFPDIDAERLALADKALSELSELYRMQAAGAQALAKAQEAYDTYASLLLTEYTRLLTDIRNKVLNKKKEADSIKSAVADKENYEQAMTVFTAADENAQSGKFQDAKSGYETAYELFCEVYDRVLAKRQAAAAAIERAKQKADEVEQYATEADLITPIPKEDVADRSVLEQEATE